MQHKSSVSQSAAGRPALFALLVGLGACVGACYSALDAATGGGSSQYADDPNSGATTDSSVSVQLPKRAWSGLNLVSQNANTMCVDGLVPNGSGVYLQECSGGVLQAFKWQEGKLRLAGNRCLDIDSSQGPPGAQSGVVLAPCDANATTQLWTFANNSNGYIHPEVLGRLDPNAPSGLCLSTLNQSSDAGSTLQIVYCNQTPAPTLWDLALFDGNTKSWGGFAISSAVASHLCFDDPNGSTDANTLLQLNDCDGSGRQHLSMRAGLLGINGVCVEVANNNPNDHAPIDLNVCKPSFIRQQFVLEHGRLHARQGVNKNHCIQNPSSPPAALDKLGFTSCTADSDLSQAPGMHWVLGLDTR